MVGMSMGCRVGGWGSSLLEAEHVYEKVCKVGG